MGAAEVLLAKLWRNGESAVLGTDLVSLHNMLVGLLCSSLSVMKC